MKKYLHIFCLILFIFFTKNVYANENNKIVFIDVEYLMNNSIIGKRTLKNLENTNDENINLLREKETILLEKEKEIKKKQNILTKEELQKEIDQLKIKISQFREEKNSIIKKSEKNKVDELNKVLSEFNKIIQNYMKENSIDIVLNKKNIFIGKVTSDITEQILNEINNKINWMEKLDKKQIIDLLPHREPMLLIDELINIKKLHSATAIINVKKNAFYVQGHFPNNPVMPGVLIVEAFGQAAAALTAAGIDKKEYENKLVFLMSVEKARFRNPVIPDCKLELNIEAIRSHGRVWKYKGEAFVEGKKMADAQWSATIVDRK